MCYAVISSLWNTQADVIGALKLEHFPSIMVQEPK